MRIRLPLVKQKGRTNCGPASLNMVLKYFRNNISLTDLEKEIGYKEGKGTSTIKLALAAKKLGYIPKLITTSIMPNKGNFDTPFYKQFSDESIESLTKLVEEAKKQGIALEEKSISQKELLSLVRKDSIPIVILDWYIVAGTPDRGFVAHYAPVVGYDSKFVYVANSSGRKGNKFRAIPRGIFEKARKSKGTDEDILIIRKKP